jgi:hypothetical protein
MMLLLQKRHVSPPTTHEELAFLTGLNRVTVTRAVKDIYHTTDYRSLAEYMRAELDGGE